MQYNQEINNLRIRLNRFRTIIPVLICGIVSSIIFIVFGTDIPDNIIFLSILSSALAIIQIDNLLSRIFSREIELLTSELLSSGYNDSIEQKNNLSHITTQPSNYSNKQHLRNRGVDEKGPSFNDKTSKFSTSKSRIDALENKQYDNIEWENDLDLFNKWTKGETGYPIVDAGMRQLNQTGYMHNRLRMITASFLTKDLGISWRKGEEYFANKLLDFDLSANNGGWQWAASTGCDAQPYFRIFNPTTQSQKFDPNGQFIKKYIPELESLSNRAIHEPWKEPKDDLLKKRYNYPDRIVKHDEARQKTLERFNKARA